MVKLRTNPLIKSTNALSNESMIQNMQCFEGLLERYISQTIHEDNLHKLLVQIFESIL